MSICSVCTGAVWVSKPAQAIFDDLFFTHSPQISHLGRQKSHDKPKPPFLLPTDRSSPGKIGKKNSEINCFTHKNHRFFVESYWSTGHCPNALLAVCPCVCMYFCMYVYNQYV